MKVLKWLERVEELFSAVLFLAAIILSLYQVFMRYVLNSPTVGILEIVEILMPWAIFIGFGRALKDGHHISVDILYDRFSFNIKRIIAVVSNLLGAGFSFFLVFTGAQMVQVAMDNGFVTTTNGIPLWIQYVVLPIGMALLGLYFLLKSYKAAIGDNMEINGENIEEEHKKYIDKGDEKI